VRRGLAGALSTPVKGLPGCPVLYKDARGAGQDVAPGETSSGHGAAPASAAGTAARGGSLRRSFLGSGEGQGTHRVS